MAARACQMVRSSPATVDQDITEIFAKVRTIKIFSQVPDVFFLNIKFLLLKTFCKCNLEKGVTAVVIVSADINECAGVTCFNGGTCVDGINTYSCRCEAGFDGIHCQSKIKR